MVLACDMMTLQNTIILGDGYIGSAYTAEGYTGIGRKDWEYIPGYFSTLIPYIDPYDYIINCIGYTDTKWSEDDRNFKKLWYTNAVFVQELAEFCAKRNKKLIHLSTTDLYGNGHDFAKNTEDRKDLDVGTNYRYSKYAAERFCDLNRDLILRIRLPFDGRQHPKNLLVKAQKYTKFYQFTTDYTYVPDLIAASSVLSEQVGIFNVVSHEDDTLLNLMKNILMLPQFQHIDPYNENDPNIIRDINDIHVHNTCNDTKLWNLYKSTNLHAAAIISYNKLTSIIDKPSM